LRYPEVEEADMNERQQRADTATANAVARGLNILEIRNPFLAKRYMEYKGVPAQVIARVLFHPGLRRRQSAEQSVSEAITPSLPSDDE
jgi:hypothetical protein